MQRRNAAGSADALDELHRVAVGILDEAHPKRAIQEGVRLARIPAARCERELDRAVEIIGPEGDHRTVPRRG